MWQPGVLPTKTSLKAWTCHEVIPLFVCLEPCSVRGSKMVSLQISSNQKSDHNHLASPENCYAVTSMDMGFSEHGLFPISTDHHVSSQKGMLGLQIPKSLDKLFIVLQSPCLYGVNHLKMDGFSTATSTYNIHWMC